MRYIQAQVNNDFYYDLNVFAAKAHMKINELIFRALTEYMDRIKLQQLSVDVAEETLAGQPEGNTI